MIRWIAVALLMTLFCSCAVTSTEFSRSGFYAGASIIGSASSFSVIREQNEKYDLGDTKWSGGIGLRAGYRFLDRLAVELAYEGAQKYDFRDADVSVRSIGVQGKFFPFTGVFQPYAMGGVGSLSADVSKGGPDESDLFWRLGLGMDVYVLEILPLFIEFDYTAATGDVDALDYLAIMVGAYFRF